MALSSVTGGAVVIDPSNGGDGWANGIYTLDAAPAGSTKMRFAYRLYVDDPPFRTVGQADNSSTYATSWDGNFWFGLRFSNAHIASGEAIPASNVASDHTYAGADDFLGYFGGSTPNYVGVRYLAYGSTGSAFCFFPTGTAYSSHIFSYGVSNDIAFRAQLHESITFYGDRRYLITDGAGFGAIRTQGWEVWRNELDRTIKFRRYYNEDSLSEANIMNIFQDSGNIFSTITIHGDINSNWVDAGLNVSFPRYFMFQFPYIGPTLGAGRKYYLPVFGYEYLQEG